MRMKNTQITNRLIWKKKDSSNISNIWKPGHSGEYANSLEQQKETHNEEICHLSKGRA